MPFTFFSLTDFTKDFDAQIKNLWEDIERNEQILKAEIAVERQRASQVQQELESLREEKERPQVSQAELRDEITSLQRRNDELRVALDRVTQDRDKIKELLKPLEEHLSKGGC
jgi:chromosome segregation ATPase